MKKFEILRELPKDDTETQSELTAVGKNGANRLAQCRVATKLQVVKNPVSAKLNKAKCSKMRYACSYNPGHIWDINIKRPLIKICLLKYELFFSFICL